MKKICLVLLVLFAMLCVPVSAVPEEVQGLDDALSGQEYVSFYNTPEQTVDDILSGRFALSGHSVAENFLRLFFASFHKTLPYLASMLGTVLLISVAEGTKMLSPAAESMALLGGRIVLCALLAAVVSGLIRDAAEGIRHTASFSEALSPVLIVSMTACGAGNSASGLAPLLSALSSLIGAFLRDLFMPGLGIGCLACLLGKLFPQTPLNGLAQLIRSTASWLMGILFSLFFGVLTIQGIASGVSDGISLRGIRYILSSSVPVIGSSVSEGVTSVMVGAYALKNALGVVGMLVIAGILIIPVANLTAFCLALKASAAFTRALSPQSASLLQETGDFLKLAVVALFGFSVLWFLTFGVIAMTGGMS